MMSILTPKNLIQIFFALEIITVCLIIFNIIPREAAFFLTAIFLILILYLKIEDSVIFFIISIPFFIALPFSETFDRIANWRIILSFLFLIAWWRIGLSITVKNWRLRRRGNIRHFLFEYLFIALILFSILSLLNAAVISAGIKKILFLINLVFLYIIIRNIFRTAKDFDTSFVRITKAIAIAGTGILIIAYIQQIFVFFAPLFTFWQWWAINVIPALYGQNLSSLLQVSNTWFSYYNNAAPSLRIFSVFPDSHSFSLFIVLTIPAFIFLWQKKILKAKLFYLWLIFAFFSIILSGSRGIWLSLFVTMAIFFISYFLFRQKLKIFLKPIICASILFLILFLFSSPMLSLNYENRVSNSQLDKKHLGFERAESIINLQETSNLSRFTIWKESLNSILKRPLFGIGIGNFPLIIKENVEAYYQGASAHNLYLEIASETGIVNLVILLAIFYFILKISFKRVNANKNPYNWFLFAFSMVFLWLFMYSFFDVVLLNDKVFLIFLINLALVASFVNKEDNKTNMYAIS